MRVRFTAHADRKFAVLRRHGVDVSKVFIIRIVEEPDRLDHSRLPLLIAQKGFDGRRVMRVVYRKEGETAVVITFYPGMKSQYEKEN